MSMFKITYFLINIDSTQGALVMWELWLDMEGKLFETSIILDSSWEE